MAGEYASWDLIPGWEREGWELLGWDAERYNAGKGPMDIPWASLTDRQKDLATLILELDEKGWTQAVEQEKQAVFDRAEEEMVPKIRSELDDTVEGFLMEVSRMTAMEIQIHNQDERRLAQAQAMQRRHTETVLAKAATTKQARDEHHAVIERDDSPLSLPGYVHFLNCASVLCSF